MKRILGDADDQDSENDSQFDKKLDSLEDFYIELEDFKIAQKRVQPSA